MDDKTLLKELFRRLGDNFFENNRNPEEPVTDSQVAADALQETLFNMGFDEGIHYKRIESCNDGVWECKFSIQ